MHNYFSKIPYHKFPKGTTSSLILLENAMKGKLLLSSHGEVSLDLFNSTELPDIKDRNWWWNFQQLPTLRWASIDWSDVSDLELFNRVFIFNSRVISIWQSSPDNVPLKWHDHATAIRLQNLYEWFLTIHRFMDGECDTETELEKIFILIREHLDKLCEDDFYSKHNNHGFEQARIMLLVASSLDKLPNAAKVKTLSLQRLNDELRFAFTEQGVHKENSPGYHCFMLKQLKHVYRFLKKNDLEIDGLNIEDLISRAEEFLYLISFENGDIPLIGDTQLKENQKKIIYELNQRLSGSIRKSGLFDYSSSGYLLKNIETSFGLIQSVFKSGFLSNYHRHDDSLSIHLAIDGVVVLGDVGLYNHNEYQSERIFARSAYAHCCFFPIATTANRIDLDTRVERLFDIRDSNTFYASTRVYPGFLLRRRLRFYSNNESVILKVTDNVRKNTSDKNIMISNYIIPCFYESYIHEKINCRFIFFYRNFDLVVIYPSDISSIKIFGSAADNTDFKAFSFCSDLINKKLDALRLEVIWDNLVLEKIELYFEFRGKRNERIL